MTTVDKTHKPPVSIDINSDGVPDLFKVEDFCEDRSTGITVTVMVHDESGREQGFVPFQGLASEGREAAMKFAYSNRAAPIRFFQPHGHLPFLSGQKAGIKNEKGEVVQKITIDGFMVGINPGDKEQWTLSLNEDKSVLVEAYQQVDGQFTVTDLEKLVWVLGPKEERFDPSRLMGASPKGLTSFESLILPLFKEVQAYSRSKKSPTDVAGKRQAKEMILSLFKSWKSTHHAADPKRVSLLCDDATIRRGIELTLGRILGLTPLDFDPHS